MHPPPPPPITQLMPGKVQFRSHVINSRHIIDFIDPLPLHSTERVSKWHRRAQLGTDYNYFNKDLITSCHSKHVTWIADFSYSIGLMKVSQLCPQLGHRCDTIFSSPYIRTPGWKYLYDIFTPLTIFSPPLPIKAIYDRHIIYNCWGAFSPYV